MKLAYIYYLVTRDQLGVEAKIAQQQRALASAGIEDVEILVLNPWETRSEAYPRFLRLNHASSLTRYADYLFRRYSLIERTVDLSAYEGIILRYPLADPSGPAFCRRYPVITEHHTLELPELKARFRQGSHAEQIARRGLWLLERRYGGRTLHHCRGIIGVTDQIREQEAHRAGVQVPTLTAGNGIDVAATQPTGFKPFAGRQLDLVFIAGNLRPWHGLDRLIRSINRSAHSATITLHVVGNIMPADLPAFSLENVRFHGPRYGRQLDEIIGASHLAVDSLAMYRRNMREGANLKVRDYTARGIPFLMAHTDPDLRLVEGAERFYLRFPNDDSLLDVDRIVDFASAVSRRPDELSAYMREYAWTHMDWQVKLRKYVNFVSKTL